MSEVRLLSRLKLPHPFAGLVRAGAVERPVAAVYRLPLLEVLAPMLHLGLHLDAGLPVLPVPVRERLLGLALGPEDDQENTKPKALMASYL